jgi:hypothetical protein
MMMMVRTDHYHVPQVWPTLVLSLSHHESELAPIMAYMQSVVEEGMANVVETIIEVIVTMVETTAVVEETETLVVAVGAGVRISPTAATNKVIKRIIPDHLPRIRSTALSIALQPPKAN